MNETRRARLEAARARLVAFQAECRARAHEASDADTAAIEHTHALWADLAIERVSRLLLASRTWRDSPVVR